MHGDLDGVEEQPWDNYIARLPNEMLAMICQHLDVRTLGHLYGVCCQFRENLDADDLIWRRLVVCPRSLPAGVSSWQQLVRRCDFTDE